MTATFASAFIVFLLIRPSGTSPGLWSRVDTPARPNGVDPSPRRLRGHYTSRRGSKMRPRSSRSRSDHIEHPAVGDAFELMFTAVGEGQFATTRSPDRRCAHTESSVDPRADTTPLRAFEIAQGHCHTG